MRILIYLPTPEIAGILGASISIPGLKIGGFKVALRVGGRGHGGRLFGMGYQFSKTTNNSKPIFRMDHHKWHGKKSKNDAIAWPYGEFHFHVSKGE